MSDLDDALARARADAGDGLRLLEAVDDVLEQHDVAPARATLERASARDAIGHEAEAVGLYREALALGLSGPDRHRCLVQLGSSLRNVGEVSASVEVLRPAREGATDEERDAVDAFLALSLHSDGRVDEALAVALRALAPHLVRYRRAVEEYADELGPGPD